jgi:hypothetical protein
LVIYHGPDTAATPITTLTTTAPTNVGAIPIAAPTDVSGSNINTSEIEEMFASLCQEDEEHWNAFFARLRQEREEFWEEFWARPQQDCDSIEDLTYDECVMNVSTAMEAAMMNLGPTINPLDDVDWNPLDDDASTDDGYNN